MKKLFAVLIACSAIAFSMTGCGNKQQDSNESEPFSVAEEQEKSDKSEVCSSGEETDKDSEKSGESSDKNNEDEKDEKIEQTSGPFAIEAGQIDKKLIGQWYNNELGGCICFEPDNKVMMSMDFSSTMYFNSEGTLVMSGVECPTTYDGKTISVIFKNVDYGSSESSDSESENESSVIETEFLKLERKGEPDKDSINGEYRLVGGDFYTDTLSLFSSENNDNMLMAIDGEKLTLKIGICEYTADGQKAELFGEGIDLFSASAQDDSVLDYTIEGDTLKMTDSSGETLEMKKQ